MSVSLQSVLSDPNLPVQRICQRQLAVEIAMLTDTPGDRKAPLNLGLILDQSASMAGEPLERVKRAAQSLVDRLEPGDRISVIAFNHQATTLVPNQTLTDPTTIKQQLARLQPQGGTAIDKGLQLGIDTLSNHRHGTVSQVFLLTDGENEHGSNQRCFELARQAAHTNITVNTLGFGYHWNADVLEQIADAAAGSLSFIEFPEDAVKAFNLSLIHI